MWVKFGVDVGQTFLHLSADRFRTENKQRAAKEIRKGKVGGLANGHNPYKFGSGWDEKNNSELEARLSYVCVRKRYWITYKMVNIKDSLGQEIRFGPNKNSVVEF